MPMSIIRNDITKMSVDAIVNSANPHVFIGDGVDGAIHKVAGAELFEARKAIGNIAVGEAAITDAFKLSAKYVIHTVGPTWHGGNDNEIESVKNCYRSSLALAKDYNCKSVAFPLISTGTYGFPKSEALQIAISVISEFLFENDMKIYLVVYDKTSYSLSGKLFSAVVEYIDDYYIDEHLEYYRNRGRMEYDICPQDVRTPIIEWDGKCEIKSLKENRSLEDLMGELDETFSQSLLRLIDQKGKTDVEVYKKANADRKLFSKIRSNPNYKPSKVTAIAFAIALELSLDETRDLINRAGFTLTHSSKFDVIIEYFIGQGNYNIFKINEVLFAFDQVLLGA
jgi:O-acetyl-ADP-ribose deacetylase (regulator of RNase III)